ncbi:hypothetical protein [Noviherbaspirillum galbum]|uniref:hypothetical protein n=1 Tax=Noviherbaspirillum galbum TaxID=2709383 RepID=UPI001969E90A|nr:hypothetical protein [Noviherbaspirillum galbum]
MLEELGELEELEELGELEELDVSDAPLVLLEPLELVSVLLEELGEVELLEELDGVDELEGLEELLGEDELDDPDPLMLLSEPLLDEPEEPELPLLMPLDEPELLEGGAEVSLLDVLMPEPELPELPELLEGEVALVVVVVTVVLADELGELGAVALLLDGSFVVVVVVVWLNAALAVPNRETKIAKGNFFMFTPCMCALASAPRTINDWKPLDAQKLVGSYLFVTIFPGQSARKQIVVNLSAAGRS